MQFILMRDPAKGQIIHREIVDTSDAERDLSDPFWEALTARKKELKGQFPDAELIMGFGESIEAFLQDYPEYQERV
ncbi:hypothetical protein J7643_02620 [bacterium]|nr:hypothetical protein [bacterium]